MLQRQGRRQADLAGHVATGTTFPVEWVPIDQPPGLRRRLRTARRTNDQAMRLSATRAGPTEQREFSRLEGTVYDRGWIYFTSTQGGAPGPPAGPGRASATARARSGRYDTASQTLHMLYESPSQDVLDFPDNVTTSPRGTLVVCEDGARPELPARADPQGRAVRHRPEQDRRAQLNDEFAGSTFSPDGETLFVNIQSGTVACRSRSGALAPHRRLTARTPLTARAVPPVDPCRRRVVPGCAP